MIDAAYYNVTEEVLTSIGRTTIGMLVLSSSSTTSFVQQMEVSAFGLLADDVV